MSCFNGRVTPDLYHNCCNGNDLCEFDGDMSSIVTAPIYVQQVFDAVKFNLQGMKTFNDQRFKPNIPPAHRIKRVIDIRCKRYFNPANIDDPKNLTLDINTNISGASFLQDPQGNEIYVVGADGTYSERIMYADTSDCDDKCQGTPVFGTQSISIYGNVLIELDLLLCDSCNNEIVFTVCANETIATKEHPMVLTNFFEICMPSTFDSAFMPRFTEFCNSACESRLATNNFGRDLTVKQDGTICGNLIIAICLTCEKKVIVPVQLCVLTTGYVEPPIQNNPVCTTFPNLFPAQIKECDTENCHDEHRPDDCGPPPPRHPQPRR